MKSKFPKIARSSLCLVLSLTIMELAFAQWTKLPGPTGGQINDLIEHNGSLYCIVTQGGSVYQSTNNGSSWTDITSGIPTPNSALSVSAIHSNGTNLFLGVNGELYISSNDGASWQLSNYSSAPGPFANSVFSIEDHQSRILVGTNGDGIYVSDDGGVNFTSTSGFPSISNIDNIFSDGTTLLAGNINSQESVYRSDDNGDTWYPASTGIDDYAQVSEFIKLGSSFFVATYGFGIFSSNDGLTWTNVFGSGPVVNQSFLESMWLDGTDIYVGTTSGDLFESPDNGTTWNHLTASSNGLEHFEIYAGITIGSEILIGTEAGIRSSLDNGLNWMPKESGINSALVNTIVSVSSELLVGTRNGVHRSADQGQTWNPTFVGTNDDFVTDLKEFNGYVFAGSTGAGLSNGGLNRSVDLGATWTDVTPVGGYGVRETLGIGSRLFAIVPFFGLYYSDNNGDNWTPTTTGLPSNPDISTISEHNGEVYIGLSNGSEQSSGGLFKSTDNGISWIPVTDGLSVDISGTIYYFGVQQLEEANGLLYATSNTQVYVLDDNTDTWLPVGNTLSGSAEASLSIGDDVIFGTFGGGIFVSCDGGNTWTQDAQLGYRYVRDIESINNEIFVTTIGGGILKNNQTTVLTENCPTTTIYSLVDQTPSCSDAQVNIPIQAIDNVSDEVIGFDFCMQYDENYIVPTGNATVGSVVHGGDPSIVDFYLNTNTPGEIQGLVYFNGNAAFPSFFSGAGDIITLEFSFVGTVSSGTQIPISLCGVTESTLYSGNIDHPDPQNAILDVVSDPFFNANIIFWDKNGRPLRYDAQNPLDYLPTDIIGTDDLCGNPASSINPDLNGSFTHTMADGNQIKIERDIPGAFDDTNNCTDVMAWINGTDQNRTLKIATADLSFIPNAFQILAADVNQDGSITAADVTLQAARSVMNICGFTNDGINPIDDWLFIDQTTFNLDPAFSISSTYPLDDGIGFSKNRIPGIPECLTIPTSDSGGCTTVLGETYSAILLGDVNGNWQSDDGATLRKSNVDYLTLNFDKLLIEDGKYVIPIAMRESTVESLDFSFNFDHEKMNLELVGSDMSGFSTTSNIFQNKFLFSSFSSAEQALGGNILNLQIESSSVPKPEDFFQMTGYLNSDKVNFSEDGTIESILNADQGFEKLSIYPNPVQNVLFVEMQNEEFEYTLINLSGKVVRQNSIKNNTSHSHEINMSDLQKGIYILKVRANNQLQYTRIAKQ